MSKPKKKKANGQFIMEDVKLLFNNLTPPETNVTFNPPPRANPATIQNNINPLPIFWTWPDQNGRTAQTVAPGDVGKYGIQVDVNVVYKLIDTTPGSGGASVGVWQSVESDIYVTWIWPDEPTRKNQTADSSDIGKLGWEQGANALFKLLAVNPNVWQMIPNDTLTWIWTDSGERDGQAISTADVGKMGLQQDINALFKLAGVNPTIWQMVVNDITTASPFELPTGAADATAYHDFYRVQIAFEDVWAELLDQRFQTTGEDLYAKYDALMTDPDTMTGQSNYYDQPAYNDNTGQTERATRFAAPPQYQTDAEGNSILDGDGNPIPLDLSGAVELQKFVDFLKIQFGLTSDVTSDPSPQIAQLRDALTNTLEGCNMLLSQLARLFDDVGGGSGGENGDQWLTENPISAQHPNINHLPWAGPLPQSASRLQVFTDIINSLSSFSSGNSQAPLFPDLLNLLKSLDKMLKEPYRFDVFAPDSINYGLMLNYRQRWQPISYQVGNLVSTIPLAPGETRRYTTKSVVKKSRNVKEIDDSLRSGKDESSDTSRVDSEIVDRAKNQTNFQKSASGNFGLVSAEAKQGEDQGTESAQTKREFHESVMKSAQEYRNEHRMEVATEESREDESTTYREIRNPNDELTVTYLFYELQRRYLVDEELHKVTPVIMVANEVPAPHEIDRDWLLRYDWIIKRSILDDSFLPALEYLNSNYAGEELSLNVLQLQVEQQKGVVDKISQQVKVANDALNAATVRLESAQNQDVGDLKAAGLASLVKSAFDPLGITGGNANPAGDADRAMVDFAKDALNRAQSKADDLVSQLRTETTALQVAIDKFTKAATQHFSMLAEIDRLRIHVKDNIIYYMQAIWTYEPGDQRYFRLYDIDVPWFTHNTTVPLAGATGFAQANTANLNITGNFPPPTLTEPLEPTMKLYQVADLENLIGFKGNYMIFPMVKFNYMTWFLMQNYLTFDGVNVGAQDPDPLANLTVDDVKNAMATIHAKDPASFVQMQPMFEELLTNMLAEDNPDVVVVPSKSLYIEALPGTHPLLEDFKLIHRALDVKKAQAEVRHAELENLRLAARLEKNDLGDPDIDKVVVVGSGKNVTVDAGQ